MKLLFSFSLLLLVSWGVVDAQEKFPQVGYSTLNGGTTGGAGGTEVTVTNSSGFIAAVKVSPSLPSSWGGFKLTWWA